MITLITVVDAGNCTSIGPDAFKGCTGLKQIKLPGICQIDDTAFYGLERVYVFAPKGGSTEEYCNDPGSPFFTPVSIFAAGDVFTAFTMKGRG